jgi:ABC-type branched-subunit amino acid transport system substrate-binding protein/TolA-binding protein
LDLSKIKRYLAPRFLVVCLALGALLGGAACVTIVSSTPQGLTGPEAILARADQAYSRGEYEKASLLYDQFLSQAQPGPREEAILATAGLAGERAGRYKEATAHYQNLLVKYPNSAYAKQAGTRLLDLYLASDQNAKAASLAESLFAKEKEPNLKATYRLTQAKGVFAQGRYLEALDLFLSARSLGPPKTKAAAEEGVGACLYNLSQPDLAEVVRQYAVTYPGPEAAYYLAYQSAVNGDLPTFAAQAEYFKRYFPRHPLLADLAQLELNPQGARALPPKGVNYSVKPQLSAAPTYFTAPGIGPLTGSLSVAAILPLTNDPSSRFAQDVLTGLKLALAKSPGQVGLTELDTHGESAQAAKLVAELAERPQVVAAVGPLTSREALAAAQMAQRVNLPLLTISNRLGLTEGRPYVFRIFLTPKHQAEAVARYATKVKGYTRLAVLRPDDPYGLAMLNFFTAEATRLGATITAVEKYAPKEANFAEAVGQLTGGGSVRRAAASFQAQTSFEALYLPDSAATVSQILAQLAYNDVTKMTYLGTSFWLTPDLPLAAGRYLTDSVIPTAYTPLSQRPEASRFREEFRLATGREPDQFAAYGYDAGLAILEAIKAGAKDRASLVRLWPTVAVLGVTGPFSFNAEGDYLVEPALLTVERGSFKLLREPLSAAKAD